MQTTLSPNLIDKWVRIYTKSTTIYDEDEIQEAPYYEGTLLGYDSVFVFYRWKKEGQPVAVPLMNILRIFQEEQHG